MAPWTPFPHAGDYAWDTTRVQQQWSQLHLGDAEPLPQDPAVLHAWARSAICMNSPSRVCSRGSR